MTCELDREAADEDGRWWNSLDVWRGLTAASVAIGAIALGMLVAPSPASRLAPPPVVAGAPWTAVVAAPDGGPKLAAVTVDADLRRVVVTPLALTAEAATALELWIVPGGGTAPRSLGLVRAEGASVLTTALPAQAKGAVLVLSREPAGGSPTGAPTGPILGAGALARS